ncbi:hypothetical protein ACLHXR_27410, partial [Klebsiella quasipneumoniae]
MAQRYNTGNQRPSNSMKDLNDNALAYDDFLNSEADTFVDRMGNAQDSLRGEKKKMAAAGAAVVEETRQNLIPLSRQYMTLAAAQADIANIPVGATTYYRSPDDSALAIEVINNGGTLEPTGRKMPSQKAVDDIEEQTRQAIDWLQRMYLGQQSQVTAISDTVDKVDDIEEQTRQAIDWLQRMYLGQQSQV